jgi:mono/diheme cytochrome c family protein
MRQARSFRLALVGLALAGAACRQDMHDAPRYEAYEKSDFFADQRSMRPQVEGTVARGQLQDDAALHTGKSGATFVATYPVPLTHDLVKRGKQRFEIYCTPCHGLLGRGDGVVVRRGYKAPPTFHQDRVRQQAPGYFFDVITNGYGTMPDYAGQIPVPDRWAIVAYVRALQLSQNASLTDVPEPRRRELDAPPATGGGTAGAPGESHP